MAAPQDAERSGAKEGGREREAASGGRELQVAVWTRAEPHQQAAAHAAEHERHGLRHVEH